MTVRKITDGKDREVTTVRPGDTIESVAKTLDANKIGAVIVSESGRSVDGILSERDIVKWIARNGAGVLEQKVSGLMTRDVVTCAFDDCVADVMGLMTRGKFRHVPVVENGELAAVVSIGDLVKYRLAEAEFEAQSMRDYIATG